MYDDDGYFSDHEVPPGCRDADLERSAMEDDGDLDRTCERCGDNVLYLSSDDLCDACVAELEVVAMFYQYRSYQVAECADVREAARELTEHTWTRCQAFRVGNLLLANDSTGPDGLQEYAVIREGWCIDSLTVSWMDGERLATLLDKLQRVTVGSEEWHRPATVNLDHGPNGKAACCA